MNEFSTMSKVLWDPIIKLLSLVNILIAELLGESIFR